jgi:hypothetical protein
VLHPGSGSGGLQPVPSALSPLLAHAQTLASSPPPHLPASLLPAILALGAVSQGCATGLAPYLPEMAAMLLPALTDARPMVRCIR